MDHHWSLTLFILDFGLNILDRVRGFNLNKTSATTDVERVMVQKQRRTDTFHFGFTRVKLALAVSIELTVSIELIQSSDFSWKLLATL